MIRSDDMFLAKKKENLNGKLVENFKRIARLLDKNDIKYWVNYGNLLGIVRNGDFIPWDDDIDLGCRASEREKICELEKELKEMGWKLFPKYNMITILKNSVKIDFFFYAESKKRIKSTRIKFKNIAILKLDSLLCISPFIVFSYESSTRLSKNQQIRLKKISKIIPASLKRILQTSTETMWSNLTVKKRKKSILKAYVFPLKKITFKGSKISVPNNVEKYLECLYGKNWKKPVIYPKYHISEEKANLLLSKLVAKGN